MRIALLGNCVLFGLMWITWGLVGRKVNEMPPISVPSLDEQSNAPSSPRSSVTTPRTGNFLMKTPFSPSSTRQRRLSSLGIMEDSGFPMASEDSPRMSLAPSPESVADIGIDVH